MPEIIDGVSTEIVIGFIALAAFALQFFFCWKWDNLFVRLLPTIAAFGNVATFFILMTRAADLGGAGDYLEWIGASAIIFGATILGWIVWGIFCFCHSRVSRNPDGY